MPLDRDSRSLKMVAEYLRRGFLVLPVIWSRGDLIDPGLEYAAIYRGNGGYGRRLGNLWVRLKWICFLAIFIWKNRNRIDLIHSVDLDVGIITAPLGRLIGIPVVYDAFDQMASFFSPGLLSRCLALVERHAINASSLAIFPDIVRLKQYGIFMVLLLISFYQRVISPWKAPSCRFYPSCSEYSRLAFLKYGLLGGFRKTFYRLCKCHPYHRGGVDYP